MNIWLLEVWTNGSDCAIADSRDAAIASTEAYYQSPIFSTISESVLEFISNSKHWHIYPHDKNLTINVDLIPETKTALEWIVEFGDGYLGRVEKTT
jgi:hypothetical protein